MNGTSSTKSSGGAASAAAKQQPAPQPVTQPTAPPAAQAAPPAPSNAPVSYGTLTDADAAALAKLPSYSDPDVTTARKLYISDSNPNGDGYSHAQNLNYKLDNGIPLNPTEQFIEDNLQYGMHSIGKDVKLVRYCHDDILKSMGIKDYSKMSQAQLQSALVGKTGRTTSYLSTSYDAKKSPFAPGQPLGGGREVVLNVNAGRNTQAMLGAKKQAEVVVNKGTNFRVTGIRYDGSSATPRGSSRAKPRVVVDIETY